MKLRMIATAVLLMIASAAISTNANAAPWRGGWRGGFYAPRPVVRVGVGIPAPFIAPPIVAAPYIAPPVVVGGGYYGGYYGYGHPYYRGGYGYHGGYRAYHGRR